jgi:hypothetical protein
MPSLLRGYISHQTGSTPCVMNHTRDIWCISLGGHRSLPLSQARCRQSLLCLLPALAAAAAAVFQSLVFAAVAVAAAKHLLHALAARRRRVAVACSHRRRRPSVSVSCSRRRQHLPSPPQCSVCCMPSPPPPRGCCLFAPPTQPQCVCFMSSSPRPFKACQGSRRPTPPPDGRVYLVSSRRRRCRCCRGEWQHRCNYLQGCASSLRPATIC